MPEGEREHTLHQAMKERLDAFSYLPEVLSICTTLREHGFSCFLVGGCVRDILLGQPPGDFDFTTDATPEQTMSLFRRTIPTGLKFGTVTVMMGKKGFELTTFRGEGAYHDGRRPELVSFKKDIYEDLSRRDFTLNALAYDPISRRLVDEFGGIRDMANHIIRTVGNAEDRLLEDGLRIMRAFRFMHFGKLDAELVDAIRKHKHILTKISKERVRVEFVKIMSYPDPSPVLRAMGEAGIFQVVYTPLAEIQENHGLWEHILKAITFLSSEGYRMKFAVLFLPLGFDQTFIEKGVPDFKELEEKPLRKVLLGSSKSCLTLLRDNTFSKKEMKDISSLIANMWAPYHHLREEMQTSAQLRLAKIEYKNDIFSIIKIARAWEKAASHLTTEKALKTLEEKLREISIQGHEGPIIDGNTIMKTLGIPMSCMVGLYKKKLYRFQVTSDITDRERLLEELVRMVEEDTGC